MAVIDSEALDFQLLSASSKPGGLHLAPTDLQLDFRSISGGRVVPTVPIELERVQGSRVGDLVSASGNLYLLSPAFQELLRTEAFTGWSTFPVAVTDDRLVAALDGFRGLVVTGRGGPVDFDRAVQTMAKPQTQWGLPTPVHRGLPLTEGRWDGSDLFLAGKMGLVFMTPRVANAIARTKLKGVVVEPASSYEIYSNELPSLSDG